MIAPMHPGSATDPHGRSAAPELRPYQTAALAALRAEFDRGVRSTLLVKATGTGKTVTFAEQARYEVTRGGRVLVVVHRDELVRQARRKCEAVGLYADVEKGKQRANLHAKVVIASVQSLRGDRLLRFAPDHFALVIVDEAHHAPAQGYRNVLTYFGEGGARILGVTATPDRADGVGLGEVFETVAYRYELREAIRDGWLAPISARRIVLEGVDLSTVKSRAGDLAQDELAAVMETEQALRGVVVPLLELARDRRTILFAVDVAHAHALADMITSYGGTARAVSGSTDEDERERLLADFGAGQFQFLVNCALLTEGYDEPSIECVAMCRPTKSRGLYMQCVGRGTRLSPETGKRDCLLLDFTATAGKHRLVGPIDCLSGALEDDVRAEVDRLCGAAQRELEEVLAAADDEVARRRNGLVASALVKYHAETIDPFIGEQQSLPSQNTAVWERERPTDKQLEALERRGVTLSKLPPEFSKADAWRLLLRFEDRRKRGLCSYRVAKKLVEQTRRFVVLDTRNLTERDGARLYTKLREGGWRFQAIADDPVIVEAFKKQREAAERFRERVARTGAA